MTVAATAGGSGKSSASACSSTFGGTGVTTLCAGGSCSSNSDFPPLSKSPALPLGSSSDSCFPPLSKPPALSLGASSDSDFSPFSLGGSSDCVWLGAMTSLGTTPS